MSPLISSSQLAALQESGEPIHLLDVRSEGERGDYLESHIPGAVFANLETELARTGTPGEGRNPLPEIRVFEETARGWGLNDSDHVVVYDNEGSRLAARAWWMLTRAGVREVRVLDGGLAAWMVDGRKIEQGDRHVPRGTVTFNVSAWPVATIDEVSDLPGFGVLVDVRPPERYRGDVEPVDAIGGHIPGAVNLPTSHHEVDGKFKAADSIRESFEEIGAVRSTPVVAYCGSGVSACHTVLAGAIAGIPVSLYPGSWSAWSSTPDRPIATGGAS